jgi:hypothetical protein
MAKFEKTHLEIQRPADALCPLDLIEVLLQGFVSISILIRDSIRILNRCRRIRFCR